MKEISELVGDGFKVKTCHCPIHGDYTGHAFSLNGIEQDPECPECYLERKKKEEQERIDRETSGVRQKLVHEVKEELIEHGADIESVNVKEVETDTIGRKKALERTKNLIDGEINILLFIGLQGTGKTVLACNAAKEFVLKNQTPNSVRYIKESQISRNIKSSYSVKSSEAAVMQGLTNIPLLIIDEVTLEVGDKEMIQIEDIICDRFSKRLPTILCGNLKREDLSKKFSARVSSRLTGYGDVIEITGKDRRVKSEKLKSNLPAFRKLYTALKTDSANAQFVTDEEIKADILNAKAEDVASLLFLVRDTLKKRSLF